MINFAGIAKNLKFFKSIKEEVLIKVENVVLESVFLITTAFLDLESKITPKLSRNCYNLNGIEVKDSDMTGTTKPGYVNCGESACGITPR